jgi:EmrB/QacA subfamily drug resistance transporter
VNTLSPRRKMIILTSCCLSLLIVSMDATIVNVAIPALRTELAASAAQLQWVIDIYTLVLASLLLMAGAAADRFGRRRVFQIGLTVFAAGSLLCSLAPNIDALIGARFIQAIGGSMLNPVAMSIITQVFTGRVERARAVGVWGAVVGISMALGPMVGGVLIEYVGWRSVFWINLPICAAAIVLTAVFVPESRSSTMRDLDPIGQGLAVTFLFAVVFVLIEGPEMGWTALPTRLISVIGVVAFATFLRYEWRRHDPFIDLRFFRSVPFSSATIVAVCAFASYGAFLFMMSLYLQGERHLTAVHTGLIYLPIALGALVFSPLSGRLVGRVGARPSLLVAGVLLRWRRFCWPG